jgi:hypothetical protein
MEKYVRSRQTTDANMIRLRNKHLPCRKLMQEHTNVLIMLNFIASRKQQHGPDGSVGVATGYGLDGPGIESRWGAIFSAPIQTGPGARPGRDADLLPLLVPWSWKSRAIPLLPLWAVRPVRSLGACTRVHFTFNFYVMHYNMTNCTLQADGGTKSMHCFYGCYIYHDLILCPFLLDTANYRKLSAGSVAGHH